MERLTLLKKERTQLRLAFTNTSKKLDELFQQKEDKKEDILARINQLEDKSERLFAMDENIRETLFSSDNLIESEYEEEFNAVEFYRDELIKYRTQVNALINKSNKHQEDVMSTHSYSGGSSKRNFRLPKLELKKFDGDVKSWIGFWGQFKKIDEDQEIDEEDKFQYLVQSMEAGSAAKELVESFPPSGDNYKKAISQLKTRFARDEFLIEVYVRELLNLVLKQSLNQKKGMSLSSLFDKLKTQLRALETLGVTTDKYAAMLYPLAESALPEDILKVWERHRSSIHRNISGQEGERDSTNHLNMLLDFLRAEVESEERLNLARTSFLSEREVEKSQSASSKVKHLHNIQPDLHTAATIFSANKNDGKKSSACIFCERSHPSQDCIKVQKLSFDERKGIVVKKNCCFGCLKPNHSLKKCRLFLKCVICGKKHFPIMCPNLHANKSTETEKSENDQKVNVEKVLTNVSNCTETLLQTILLRVTHNRKTKVVRALLDSASQRSYILSTFAQEMCLPKINEETIIQGVFGGSESSAKIHNVYDVSIESLDSSFKFNIQVLDQPKICQNLPKLSNKNIIHQLKKRNIIISDIETKQPEIILLLGADIIGHLFTGVIEKIDDELFVMETHLGWTIMGKQYDAVNSFLTFSSLVHTDSISDLWSLDVLGIRDPGEVKSKEKMQFEVMNRFSETIMVNELDRYEVPLIWIDGHPQLLDNYNIAEKRLITTTKKLIELGTFQEYENVFSEWKNLGIIEEVPDSELKNRGHYLPHHAVLKSRVLPQK